MQEKQFLSTVSQLQDAVNSSTYLICDMRSSDGCFRQPILNSFYIYRSKPCELLLKSLLRWLQLPVLLIAEADEIENNYAWLRSKTNESIKIHIGNTVPIPKDCLCTDSFSSISAEDLADMADQIRHLNMIDIRTAADYDKLYVCGSQNIPLEKCGDYFHTLEHGKTYYVYGAENEASLCFLSLLQYFGYRNMVLVEGGFPALRANGRFYTAGTDASGLPQCFA